MPINLLVGDDSVDGLVGCQFCTLLPSCSGAVFANTVTHICREQETTNVQCQTCNDNQDCYYRGKLDSSNTSFFPFLSENGPSSVHFLFLCID